MTILDPTTVYRMRDGRHPDGAPRFSHYAFNPASPQWLESESGGLLPFNDHYLPMLEPTDRSMDEFQQAMGRERQHQSAVGAWCDETGIYE